ncbi:MAG: CGNR zinc finger domain-containing protein [Thermoleophilia bacterium]|nr:CGNR zinc finger domain-containing protein [Thermoleophilia bacterium]
MNRFSRLAGRPSLDLCNTAAPAERLITAEDLAEWMAEAGLVAVSVRVAGEDLEDVRRLRAGLRGALLAGDGPALAGLAADWLAAAPGCLTVDPATLEPRFRPARESTHCLLVPVLLDALELARLPRGRVRECAGEDCTAVYLDTSRNHSRRWCSMDRCGSRAKASAYYHRRRGEAPGLAGPPPP